MKHIKKLSSKLLLALGVILLGVIVWQVIVSKRLIGDTEKIKRAQSIEQIHDLLKTGELKTYCRIPCSPFSKIKLNRFEVYILKGNEYAVYMSNYCKKHVEVVHNGDELLLNNKSLYPISPVFIFIPEDPQSVYYTPPDSRMRYSSFCKIQGFKGENTLISCEGGNTEIRTDMPYINVNQKENNLHLFTSSLDSTFRMNNVRLNVHAENSWFRLDDPISDSIHVNIQLQESDISESLRINPKSKVGTLSLKGSLHKENYHKGIMNINYPGPCDSLIIQLSSNFGNAKQIFLSEDLSGRFEDINCSENVIIVRGK